ncbi:hypothetical protein MtrunA17_Chr4g0066891 [Medicago truncatula]|uniref:Uncharacterized protein n=1 Tax=Medicago truncatula TaxID=3880 RepID=A0A396IK77_MEDTR|nr:hypothetical protein MtrunA17_Chr4g0066891 [Medicago truncatula]
MSSSFCGKFQISLSLINFHSSTSNFKNRELPNVLRAKGSPPHFCTISFPISTNSGYFFSSSSLKAHLTNTDKESSRERPSKMYDVLVPIILAIEWLRVVTKTLLSSAPTCIKYFNSTHLTRSSFHTSSKTSKNFLPAITFLRRFCSCSKSRFVKLSW